MLQRQVLVESQVVGICLRTIACSREKPFLSDSRGSASSSVSLPSARQILGFPRQMDFWNARLSSNSNKSLLEMLQVSGSLKSQRIKDVMKQVDRGLFVPEGASAYADNPLPIGYNATISAPHMHAECLQLLEQHLQPGMHALDVGSGSGYLTAVFSILVGDQGRAVGVEHIPELVQQSVKNVQRSKAATFLSSGTLSLHVGDGREGWPESAPYDAIHVGAAAETISRALIQQLKPGGRMVIPVGDIRQDLKVVDKDAEGKVKEWTVTAVRYVPLTSREDQLRGY